MRRNDRNEGNESNEQGWRNDRNESNENNAAAGRHAVSLVTRFCIEFGRFVLSSASKPSCFYQMDLKSLLARAAIVLNLMSTPSASSSIAVVVAVGSGRGRPTKTSWSASRY